jgi:BlaI family transcriptional regulator, penicillinase repressor
MTRPVKNGHAMQLTSGRAKGDIVGNASRATSLTYVSDSFSSAHTLPSENSMKFPRLTRCELELMDVLWKKGEATVQEVCDELTRPLAYTTVMTTLGLLHSKKKVLKRIKRGRAHVYQPIISRDEVSRAVLTDLRDVLFADQLPMLVLGLLEDGKFSHADVQALKAAIRKVETEGEA